MPSRSMPRICLPLAALAGLILAGLPGHGRASEAVDTSIGAVFRVGSTLCLRIKAAGLTPQTRIVLIDPDPDGQSAPASAMIVKPAPGCGHGNRTGYAIRPSKAISGGVAMFGVVGSGVRVHKDAGGPVVTVAGLGALALHACASADGIHLTVWNGHPLAGPRLWHDYIYLNQDLDPDCTAKETS